MSTLLQQLVTEFTILKKDKLAVLAAIKDLPGKERDLDLDPDNHFAYIDFQVIDGMRHYYFEACQTLENAFLEWNWSVTTNEAGDIVGLAFIGFCDGDYDILFKQVAPWVVSGSYIEMVRDDNFHFRFGFQDGKMVETKLKEIPGLSLGTWEKFWVGKAVKRSAFYHRESKYWQILSVDVKRNLTLSFTPEEVARQTFLEVHSDVDVYLFAPQGSFVYVFRVEKAISTKGDIFPLLYFVGKI